MNPQKAEKLLEILGKKTHESDAFLELVNDKSFLDLFKNSEDQTDVLAAQMQDYFQSIEIPEGLKNDILETIKTAKDKSDKMP